MIRPSRNPTFNVPDIISIKRLKRLRVKLSDLHEHKFRHNFDCLIPICDCGMANEDNEHPLPHRPPYDIIRQDPFAHLKIFLEFNVLDMDSIALCDLLLFGKPNSDLGVSKMIVVETINFIENAKRL